MDRDMVVICIVGGYVGSILASNFGPIFILPSVIGTVIVYAVVDLLKRKQQ